MVHGHPLYASITKEPIHDSDLPSAVSDAEEVEIPAADIDTPQEGQATSGPDLYRELPSEYEWILDLNDVLDFDVGAYLALAAGAADAFAAQIEAGILAHISDIAEASGNVVSATGRDVVDAFLDSMETMDFSFNDAGEPNITIVIHPDQFKKLQGIAMTAEQQSRHDEIIAKRREEWNASQRRQELPGVGDRT